MRVLVVSQYFPPEIGATQNRMDAFVTALIARGHHVTVICEQPNHPEGVFHAGYGRAALTRERSRDLSVNRLWVYASSHKSTLNRLLFYGTFALGAPALAALLPRPDVVLVTSPPLPGALTIGLLARLRRIPFVLDVRDLWPSAAEALGELSDRRLIRAFERAERWLYRSAAAVTATTLPFCCHIERLSGRRAAVHIPNGALDALISTPARPAPSGDPFRVGYFGNLGIAQGLDVVLDAASELADQPVHFQLVGSGPLEEQLRARIAERRLANVELPGAVATNRVGEAMQRCHALLVPLASHPALGDFIPSKLYDAMAVGRPSIVVARGEAADLVSRHDCGISIPPGDARALAQTVRLLHRDRSLATRLGEAGRKAAPGHARSRQAERLCDLLEGLARTRLAAPASLN